MSIDSHIDFVHYNFISQDASQALCPMVTSSMGKEFYASAMFCDFMHNSACNPMVTSTMGKQFVHLNCAHAMFCDFYASKFHRIAWNQYLDPSLSLNCIEDFATTAGFSHYGNTDTNTNVNVNITEIPISILWQYQYQHNIQRRWQYSSREWLGEVFSTYLDQFSLRVSNDWANSIEICS